MKYRCIAIDDEPLALDLVRDYVARMPGLELVQTFDDAVSAAEFIRNNQVDILLVDIHMPDISGLDLVRSLAEKPAVIFITAHKKFALDGFELDATDYLLKPVSFDRFSRAIQKAIDFVNYRKKDPDDEQESLFVYSEYRLVKILLEDIEYIESLRDYIRIHIANEKPLLTLMPLKKVLEKLPAGRFQRIHRSYIVNVSRIRSVLNKKICLTSSIELPVSDSYAEFLRDWKK